MTLSLINTIPDVCFAKNSIVAQLQTNNFVLAAGSKSKIVLTFSACASVDDEFMLNWLKISEQQVFIFVAIPDDSGLQLTADTGGLLADWLDALVIELANNYYLNRDFTIAVNGNDIEIEAINIGTDYSFDFTNSVPVMAEVNTAGISKSVNDNFVVVCDVYVQDSYPSGDFEKKASQSLVPDDDSNCKFYLQNILKANLTAYFPEYSLVVPRIAESSFKKWKFKYAEFYGETPTYQRVYESDEIFTFYAGLNFMQFPSNNYFPTWLPANKRFLSWKNTSKSVTQTQKEFLSYLVHGSGVTSIIAKCKMYYSDSINSTVTLFTQAVNQKEVWIFPSGYTESDLENKKTAGKTITRYEFWLTDQAGTIISEVITYTIDTNNYYHNRAFYYSNSLSGIDSIICTGKRQDNLAIERKFTEQILEDYWSDSGVTKGQSANYNNSYQFEFAISSGFRDKKAAITAMIELLISTEVREEENGVFKPIILKANSFKLYKDENLQYFLEFEYADAFTNNAYSDI